MVQIVVKRDEEDQFMVETSVNIGVDQLIRDLVAIHNMRTEIRKNSKEIKLLSEVLAKAPKSEQSDDEVEENLYTRTINDAEAFLSKNQVLQAKKVVTLEEVKHHLETVTKVLEVLKKSNPDLQIPPPSEEEDERPLITYDPDTASLWWANKDLQRNTTLSTFVGKNEKTKIVAKLQKKGNGPPVRDPVVDKDTEKALMAHYYKKQQEQQKLEDDSEDAYLNSSWADPKALKNAFNGLSNITWKSR